MNEAYSTDPVIQLNEVFPGDTNALDTLFGGRLMSIMDTAAGMAASKFAHRNCSGFFFMVAIDRDMKAINIPQFKPETDDEIEMWEAAQKARDAMR